MNETPVFHTGDYGDIIASLLSARELGHCRYFIGWRPSGARESMRGPRYDALKPLLEVQPHVSGVEWTEALPAYYNNWRDFSTFRSRYRPHTNLGLQQAEAIGVRINSFDPWLTIPDPIQHNRPVITRTSRYHNSLFPWRRVLQSLTSPIFIGLPIEYRSFAALYSGVEYKETKDILEMAQMIAGASVLVSNQTAAWWIGAGSGIPVIQESYLTDLNSVIDRPNLLYSRSASEINDLICTLTSKPFLTENNVTQLAETGGLIKTE